MDTGPNSCHTLTIRIIFLSSHSSLFSQNIHSRVSTFTAASVFPPLLYFVHIKYGCFPQLNFKPYGFPPFLYLVHVKYGCFPQLNFKPHAFPPLLHFHYTINMGYLKKYISKLSSSKGASISAKSPLPIPLLYSL